MLFGLRLTRGGVPSLALVAVLLAASSTAAQTDYFWNAPTGGTGTWDTATQNWSTTATGPVDYTWTNSGTERANFGDTAGTVTVAAGGITTFGVNFTITGYTVDGGALTLAGAGGPIAVGAAAGDIATINAALGGTVGLTKSGAGILVLGTATTYTGATTVSGGTLRAGAANVFSSSGAFSLANAAGVILDLNNTSQTLGSLAGGGTTGGVVAVGTGSLTVGGANTNTTYSGQFTGSGTITKVGSGTLTIASSGTTAWTGPLTINEGVVSYAANGQLGNTGLVTLNGGTLRHTNAGSGGTFLLPTRSIAIGPNGGTIEYTTAGANTIYRGTITGPGNTLTKIGAGEFRVDTAAANNTFGKLVVNQGLFRVGATGPETGFGAAPGSPLADAITLNGGAIGTSAGITLNANRGITLGAGGGTINVTAAPLTIPSVITGSGALAVLGDAETDVLTLSGANNYTGATTITTSRLTMGAANTLPSTTAVTVGTGATLNLAGFSQTIGSLAGGGNVTLGVNGVLTTGGNNTSTTHSGVISGASGSLVKQGTGTLTLSGLNTYLGGTTITAGTLQIGVANALPATGTVALNGGTLSTGTGVNQNTGALAVPDSSTITLGTNPHTLTFASFGTLGAGETLTITGWQGDPGTTGSAGKIVFTDTSGLTPAVLAAITFTGDPDFGTGAQLIGGNELVPNPVPEPGFVVLVAAAGVGLWARRRAARRQPTMG